MKAAQFIILIALILLVAGCSNTPKEFKEHPCAEFCFEQKTNDLNPQFVDTYDQIVAPACLKIKNYESLEGGLIIRITPACEGEDTYCDCKLRDGTYLTKT